MYGDAIRLFLSLMRSSSREIDLRPNSYTASCVLKAFSFSHRDWRAAKELHCFIMRGELCDDPFVVNALITYYSSCDCLCDARKVFDKMPEKDIVSWNSMIAGYSQGGFYEECKGLYRQMLSSSGLLPNGLTVVSLLKACGQSKDIALGMEVHHCIYEHQVEVDIGIWNALIGMYAKCGSLDFARDLFLRMSEKDEVTYNTLISGYMAHGFVQQAMDIFREMRCPGLSAWNSAISGLFQNSQYDAVLDIVREMQASGLRPNSVTVASVLPTFSYFLNPKGVIEMHAFAFRNGYNFNIYVATAFIDTYAKVGLLQYAQRVFNQSNCRSLVIWTAIIAAHAAHGYADAALGHFDEMLSNGIRPDHVTFTSVLTACARSGTVDKALEVFDAMFQQYGIRPSQEHYACVVGALSCAGRLSEAMDFVSKMPFNPSAKVWGALLNGASVSRDVELGKYVCDRLFEMEPENTGNYIIMANLYSQAGRWDEAEMVRKKMSRIGLKKIPGSSMN